MHRRPEAELLPLDIELERTLRNLKKLRVAEVVAMADQKGTNQHQQSQQQKGLKDKGP